MLLKIRDKSSNTTKILKQYSIAVKAWPLVLSRNYFWIILSYKGLLQKISNIFFIFKLSDDF